MKNLLICLFLLISVNLFADSTNTQLVTTIDQLIEKYTPKIEEGLSQLYSFTKTTGKQAFEIFYKYLLFQNIYYLTISLVILIVLSIITYKVYNYCNREYKKDGDDSIYGVLVVPSVALLASIPFVFVNCYDLLSLIIVPEITILKEILNLTN